MLLHLYSSLSNKHFSLAFLKSIWPLSEEQIPAILWPQAVERFGLLRLRQSELRSSSPTSHRDSPSSSHQQPCSILLRAGTGQHTTAQRQEQEPRETSSKLNTLCLHLDRKVWISGLQQVGSSRTEAHLGHLVRHYQALDRRYWACSIIQNGSNMGYETTLGGGEPVLYSQDLKIKIIKIIQIIKIQAVRRRGIIFLYVWSPPALPGF